VKTKFTLLQRTFTAFQMINDLNH